MGNRDHSAMPQRSLRTHPLPAVSKPTDQPEGQKPFGLVVVCLWSVIGVALTALLIWLALGID
jgi:hypothetical protein